MAAIDTIPAEQLGERLRAARSSARRTQEQAASHLGVARTTLVAMEKGERRVRMAELQVLADYYGTSCNALLHVERPMPELVPQFRMMTGRDPETSDALDAVRLLERLAAAFAELARIVGYVVPTDYPPPVRLMRDQVAEQAEDTAMALRSYLGLGLSPIPDLAAFLEAELQFRIFVRPLPSRISGVYGFTPAVGPCVLLNAVHPVSRRQNTVAHEAGHFMSTREAVEVALQDSSDGDIVSERFASRFGPALLMPGAALRRRYNEIMMADGRFSPRHLIYLAHTFHVSVEGMCRRLEALRLVKNGTWEMLNRQGFGMKQVQEVRGPAALRDETKAPSRLNLLAADAYERGLVSEGQLARMLVLDRLSVRELLDDLVGDELGGADAL